MSVRVRSIKIIAPLLNIAVHVVKAPCVWFFQSNGVRLAAAIVMIPGNLIQMLAFLFVITLVDILAVVQGGGGAGATRIFPLGLGRKGEFPARW